MAGAPDPTSTESGVDYNILTGRGNDRPAAELSGDALGTTAMGAEIKERFRSMRAAFLKMDTNHDGKITIQELREMCAKWNIPAEEAERVLEAADLNQNGTLDFNEFALRFNPDDGEFGDSGPAAPGPTAYDQRAVGGGSGGTSGAAPRGDQQREGPAAGSGAAAVRSGGGGGGGCTECAALRARVAQCECAALRARVAELEQLLAASRAREAELSEALDSEEAQERRRRAAAEAAAAAAAAAAEEERLASCVIVYGRAGDVKTGQTHKELRKAGIEFVERDFDKDKRYMQLMEASGFTGGKHFAPIVCIGKQAFWDEPDQAIAVHFPSYLVNELRKLGLGASNDPVETASPMKDASMETEIYERFKSMQQAFLKVDANKDGRISKKELLDMCKQWNIPKSEAERVLCEADLNMDGTLDFNEFALRFGNGPPS